VVSRLEMQRAHLLQQVHNIRRSISTIPTFSDHILLVAEMFDDSFSFSKTPRDLFQGRNGTLIRGAATATGSLIEKDAEGERAALESSLRRGSSIAVRCDISRVKSIRLYSEFDIYRSRSLDGLWERAPGYEEGRGFVVWLLPFKMLARGNL